MGSSHPNSAIMKLIIVLCLAAVASSRPQSPNCPTCVAAEPYVHQEIEAEPYIHVEVAAEPYVHIGADGPNNVIIAGGPVAAWRGNCINNRGEGVPCRKKFD